MQIQLSPDFDPGRYQTEFAQNNHIQIKPILTKDSAHKLHKILEKDTAWNTVFNDGNANCEMTAADIQSVGPQMAQKIVMDVLGRARTQFQFLYQRYPLTARVTGGQETSASLKTIYDFLNGNDFLNAMREVTGLWQIQFTDPNPTLYKPGNFLTHHDDDLPGQGRLAAFVLNLTPEWRPEWGGNLLFHDGDGRITGGYAPVFNAINIFKVPINHFVSYVAPFAMARYSITGWLRTHE